MRQETEDAFSKLVSKIHETKKDTFVIAQLTHSGRNSIRMEKNCRSG